MHRVYRMNVEAKQQLHAYLMRTREAVAWKTNGLSEVRRAQTAHAHRDEPARAGKARIAA